METLLHDIRYAARRLARSPGFTLAAVLTLALGIGANSAIFSVVHAVLLRPLPYPDAERLVLVTHVTDTGDRATMSPANFRDVRAQSRSLEALSFWAYDAPTLTGAGDPVQLKGASVGAHFFDVLRIPPLLGRTFAADENGPGRNRVAVLSHALWRQSFGSDAGVIGRPIVLGGVTLEVVGVMPEGFGFPSSREVWTPHEYDAEFTGDASRGSWYLTGIGRLKPDVPHDRAEEEIQGIAATLQRQYPETNTKLGIAPVSLYEQMVGDVRPALLVLLGAVGFVLLIACANVANLLLARAAAREGEFAVRTALGAARGRLIRQLITESLLLGVLGGGAGLLLAVWGTAALVALKPQGIPRLSEVGVDPTVAAFTLGVALLSGVLFGLVPALQATRSNLALAIREGGRGTFAGRRSSRIRSTLVVVELALSVVLLTGAGLLIRSFVQLQRVDPGFSAQGVLAFRLSLPDAAYGDESQQRAFFDAVLERLKALPGVRSAAAVSDLPMSGSATYLTFDVQGREPARPGEEPGAQILRATPEYFRTLGIPLSRGRDFSAADSKGAPPVVVLNEAAVRRLFPDEEPIGQGILLALGEDTVPTARIVVGVVRDVRQFGMDTDPEPAVFIPQAQAPDGTMDVVVGTTVPPLSVAGAIRAEVEALDPNLPLTGLQTLSQRVSESVSQPRFYMLLLSAFAAVALLLASIGIFGVISYTVTRRTREIGVRIALGADPRSVVHLVVGGALGLAALGVGLGLVGALAGTRLLSGLLFGVEATDPPTFAGVALLLIAVAALASYLPARRATRVDPSVALHSD